MQTIADILHLRAEQQKQPRLLPDSQPRNNDIVATYGQREQFLASFNPDMQLPLCANPEGCVAADVPTLSQANAAYGSNTAIMWLVPQLYDLSEYCGCRDKLRGRPLEQCAAIIAAEYHFLKPTELMLFFHRFKTGRYGRFYGAVDPLVITSALRDFMNERNAEIIAREQLRQMAAFKEYRKQAISYDEYLKNKQHVQEKT